MYRILLLWSLATLALSCRAPAPDVPSTLSRAPAGSLDGERRETILKELALWVAEEDPVGCELLIIERGQLLLHDAVGWSDREGGVAWEPGAICRLRSLTKPYIATLALQLITEGALSLDEPITRWLPTFDHDTARTITPRHLLQQTAGFDQPGYPGDLVEYGSLRELADAIGRVGPRRVPGTVFVYSDASTIVLGALVAEVCGKPLELLLAERLLAPQGLEETLSEWAAEDPLAQRIVPTYQVTEAGVARYWDRSQTRLVPWLRASGGLFASAADVAKLLGAWLERDAERGVGVSNDLRQAARAASLQSRASPFLAYGFHWQLFSSARPGTWSFGHTGSDGTIAWADPSRDRVVVFLTQTRGTSSVARIPSLIDRVLE